MKAIVASINPPATRPDLKYYPEHSNPVPGPNDVLLKIKASAIQPSDYLNVTAGFPHTTFPRIPGRDFSGILIQPTTHRLYGRAVYGSSGHDFSFTIDGAHAEYTLASESAIAEMPGNLSFAQAASVGIPFTTAFLVLKRAGAEKGETIMVLGATGSVGGAVCQVAKAHGCRILTVSRRDTADIDLKTDPDLLAAKALTDGRGPDVVVDTIGDLRLMNAALASLGKGGRLACISTAASVASTGTTELEVDIKMLYRFEHSIIGCNSVERRSEELSEWLAEMKVEFEAGNLVPPSENVLTKIPIEDAVSAYESMGCPSGRGKKFVIVFEES